MAPTPEQAGVVRDFKRAWEAKDFAALIALLDPDAMAIADGGRLAVAALQPVEGGDHIARYLLNVIDKAPSDLTFLERAVSGQPGLVAQQGGVTASVSAFQVFGDRITRIWAVRNPDKLRLWTGG